MLTKDLVVSRRNGSKIIPVFQRTDNPELLELAERMITSFELNGEVLRCDLDETLHQIASGFHDLKVASGLRKVLESRAVFSAPAEMDYQLERRKVFLASAKLLRSGEYSDENDYARAVDTVSEFKVRSAALYSDLRDNDRLISFRDISAKELIEHYNIALVQGLLLQASSMELEFDNAEASRLRRLFSLVRFNRLVATASTTAPKKTGESDEGEEQMSIHLNVDGPGSVLANPRGYGYQLASFFPAIVNFRSWRMTARITCSSQSGKSERTMKLDELSGLVNHDAFGSFVPEEVGMFIRHFKESGSEWRVLEETPFLKGRKAMLLFPDFAFEHPSGKRLYLELFHRWHADQLAARLDELDNGSEMPLVIGVDKAIAERPDISTRLDASTAFARQGFLYRDYPTIDRVSRTLDKALEFF
ncbi:MAG: DUF790 family protein [Victivallales bacterium]|nr:DUF790 family protein [Victivallales bacterium]